jgi:GGDEF domain-containing protein
LRQYAKRGGPIRAASATIVRVISTVGCAGGTVDSLRRRPGGRRKGPASRADSFGVARGDSGDVGSEALIAAAAAALYRSKSAGRNKVSLARAA